MTAPLITSRQNPLVSRFRAAAEGDAAWMLLEGRHLLDEAVAAGLTIDVVAVAPDRVAPHEIEALSRLVGAGRLASVSGQVLDAISPARAPGGVVALASRPRHAMSDAFANGAALVLAAVQVQDPGNVGAVLRAAEAGGATGVLVTPGSADPFGWKALRGAMGSAFRLPVVRAESLDAAVEAARDAGCQVVAAAGRGHTPIGDADLSPPTLVLLGSEGQGLPPAVVAGADLAVSIPMAAPVESLNVAVAAALIVYEARRQRLSAVTTT